MTSPFSTRPLFIALGLLLVLVLLSCFYNLFDVRQGGWSWGRALGILTFLRGIWHERITDSFWYLYFYLGLMVMLAGKAHAHHEPRPQDGVQRQG